MALAVEGDVLAVFGGLGILRIGTDPIEGAVEVRRQPALDLAVIEIDLGAVHRQAGAAAAAEAGPLLGEQDLGLRRGGRQPGQGRAGAERRRAEEAPAVGVGRVLSHVGNP